MVEITRQQLVVYAAAFVAIALIGARHLKEGRDPPVPAGQPAQVKVARGGGGGAAYVHVTGAVRRPGVYRLPAWARLDAAVRRAGGATARADMQGVNLAAKVADGQQVVVPARVTQAGLSSTGAGDPANGQAPISLNTATIEQLDRLSGIGPVTAQRIIEWREAHGGFTSVEQLREIDGIGERRLASLRPQVTV